MMELDELPYSFAEDRNVRNIVREILHSGEPSAIAMTRKICEALDEHLALTGREVTRRVDR